MLLQSACPSSLLISLPMMTSGGDCRLCHHHGASTRSRILHLVGEIDILARNWSRGVNATISLPFFIHISCSVPNRLLIHAPMQMCTVYNRPRIGHHARYYCPSSKVTKKPLAAREGLQKGIEEQMSDYEGVKERWGREGETTVESG